MRGLVAAAVTLGLSSCALDQLGKSGSPNAGGGGAADAGAEAGLEGTSCGIESGSQTELCRATSACPGVTVDSATFPHCGFRIRGTQADLVCGCGTFLCSMGTVNGCGDAAKLLMVQTEYGVCSQISEDRCTESAVDAAASNPSPCDQACLAECGGGAACAALCHCE